MSHFPGYNFMLFGGVGDCDQIYNNDVVRFDEACFQILCKVHALQFTDVLLIFSEARLYATERT